MNRRLWILMVGVLLTLQISPSSAVLTPEGRDLTYTPGTPVKVDAGVLDVGRLTLTGDAQFANPTGGAPEQVLTLKVTADKHYKVTWGDKYHASYGHALPLMTTGKGVIDEWEFRLNPKTGLWAFLRSTQPEPRLMTCPILIGTTTGPVLKDAAFAKPGICQVPGSGLVVEVHVKVDGGSPTIMPTKQSGNLTPETLGTTPITLPDGKTAVCVRAKAEPGLSGMPCVAGLTNLTIPDGEWSLGASGKAGGNTRQAVVTIYYWVENL